MKRKQQIEKQRQHDSRPNRNGDTIKIAPNMKKPIKTEMLASLSVFFDTAEKAAHWNPNNTARRLHEPSNLRGGTVDAISLVNPTFLPRDQTLRDVGENTSFVDGSTFYVL